MQLRSRPYLSMEQAAGRLERELVARADTDDLGEKVGWSRALARVSRWLMRQKTQNPPPPLATVSAVTVGSEQTGASAGPDNISIPNFGLVIAAAGSDGKNLVQFELSGAEQSWDLRSFVPPRFRTLIDTCDDDVAGEQTDEPGTEAMDDPGVGVGLCVQD
jgi:hypothetical protein